MKTIDLSRLMIAHELTKEQISVILFPKMDAVGRKRKVARLIRGEQALNADELITLAAALLVTPNDLYLAKYIDPLKQIKTYRVLEVTRQALEKAKNEKTQNEN